MMELFLGTWTYRSLLNDPDLSTDFDALEFGRAIMSIETFDPGHHPPGSAQWIRAMDLPAH